MIKKLLVLLTFLFTLNAFGNVIPLPTQAIMTPEAPNLKVKAYILQDVNSGKILAEKNASEHMAPASLTKMMTMYVIDDALKKGQISLQDKVKVSTKAWKAGGSYRRQDDVSAGGHWTQAIECLVTSVCA